MSEIEIVLRRDKIGAALGFKIRGGVDGPYENAKFDTNGIYVSKLEKRYDLKNKKNYSIIIY